MKRPTRLLVAGVAVAVDIGIAAYAFTLSSADGVIVLAIVATVLSVTWFATSHRWSVRSRLHSARVQPSALSVSGSDSASLALGSEFAFQTVIAMAAAIQGGDVAEFKRLGTTLKRENPSPAHVYAWILLGQSIIERDHQKPDEARIEELVSEASLLLRLTGRATNEDAARVLRIIFGDPDSSSANPLSDFLITVVLLGALVTEPLEKLPKLRPHVIRLSAKFAAQAPEEWGYLVRSVEPTSNP